MDSLFPEGGPHKAHQLPDGTVELSISLPVDSDGLIGRECSDESCSPAFFKIKLGTGVKGQIVAFCPYCRSSGSPRNFSTKEQVRYARDMVAAEAMKGIKGMLEDSLGLGPTGRRRFDGGLISLEVSLRESPTRPVRQPFEEELRRDLTCPVCRLDHAVFGLATWCPDCGADIFLTHVEAEIDVIRKMLRCVGARREELGARVAARDIENALEDAVSILEAVLKAITRRHLATQGLARDAVEQAVEKIGNAYQNPVRAGETFKSLLSKDLYQAIDEDTLEALNTSFAKRHPIAHNLGVVDRRYLARARSGDLHGQEIRVDAPEVERALDSVLTIVRSAHTRLFPDASLPPEPTRS